MRHVTPWIEIGTALPAVLNNNTTNQVNYLNCDNWLAVKKLVKPQAQLFLQTAVEVDDEDPTLVLVLQYDTFGLAVDVEDPTNWTIDFLTSGLTLGTITRDSDTQVTITTTGTVTAGQFHFLAEAAIMATYGVDSENMIYNIGTSPEISSSVVWEEERIPTGFTNDLSVYAINGAETYYLGKESIDTNATNQNYFAQSLEVPPVNNIALSATYDSPQTYCLFAKVIQADRNKPEAL